MRVKKDRPRPPTSRVARRAALGGGMVRRETTQVSLLNLSVLRVKVTSEVVPKSSSSGPMGVEAARQERVRTQTLSMPAQGDPAPQRKYTNVKLPPICLSQRRTRFVSLH